MTITSTITTASNNMADIVSSDKNPTIKLAKALLTSNRQRNKNAMTVIEGTHLLDSALNANYPIEQVLVAESALQNSEVVQLLQRLTELGKSTLQVVADKLYQDIRTLGTGIDIMAIIPVTPLDLPVINEDCLILNDVQDSGNVGTLLRTAAAIGIKHIICTTGTAGAWSPKTLRAGMGAQFSLTIYENVTVDTLITQVQIPMLATSSHTNKVIYHEDLTQATAWVMGHEGQGVCDDLMAKSVPIALPQPNGQESLNVAIAGALCMYEMLRQREYN